MNFGVLCNGPVFQKWQLESIRLLIEGGHSCKLLIVNANEAKAESFSHKIVHYPYTKFLCRFWFRYMIKPNAKIDVNINEFYADLQQIECKTIQKGYAEYFSNEDVESIKFLKLDFILRYGFGILKGQILDAAKYGVWSYHHDDDRKYRGIPTGFWEIMFNDPVNAAILQRLTEKIDSGVILHKAYFTTINHSWHANLNNILERSTEWPLQVCRRIESGNTDFLSVTNLPVSAIYKMPGNLRMLRFLIKVATNKLKFHFKDLFQAEKWNVGIIPSGFEELENSGKPLPEPKWLNLSHEKSVYHADPFGFVKDGICFIVCEEYDYRNAKGVLKSFQVNLNTGLISNETIALEKDYHLAFPYLFEYSNNWYCIPENSAGGNVELYRFDYQTGKLIFEQTLVENLQAIDLALFFHEGNWWMFFTDKIATNERLKIWYSPNLHGPYKSHFNNPVKVDIRSSRPAGNPFIHKGKLLRPAQDCSIRSGRQIVINEIVKLSPTEFEEKEYLNFSPSKIWKYKKGMHTFCVTEKMLIVDGKNENFIWQAFMQKFKSKISRLVK
jgi:hypothetical protein